MITCKRSTKYQIQTESEFFRTLTLKVGYKYETFKENTQEYKILIEYLNLKHQSLAYRPIVKKAFDNLLKKLSPETRTVKKVDKAKVSGKGFR